MIDRNPEMLAKMEGFVENYWYLYFGSWVVGVVVVAPLGFDATAHAFGAAIGRGLVGAVVLRWMLNGLRSWSSGWRTWFLIAPLLGVVVNILSYDNRLPLGIISIVYYVAWAGYVYSFLLSADVAAEFKRG